MGIIYQATNTINGKKYIGKTIKTLIERRNRHVYTVKYGSMTYFHQSIRKNGIDSFEFLILEETNDLDNREQYWIEVLKPEYNMTQGGEGGDTSHSPKYIEALMNRDMSGNKNPMYGKKGKDNPNYGKKRGKTPLISAGLKENWKTNPTRRKLAREAALGNKHGYNNKKQSIPIMVDGIKYNSIGQAMIATGLTYKLVNEKGIRL